jgi:hypothetical protein
MNIEDPNSAQDSWIAFVEDAVLKGKERITVPAEALTDGAAAELAGRLNLSVKAEGSEYLFVRRAPKSS